MTVYTRLTRLKSGVGEGSTYFFASATARARIWRFFSSTLMRFTETAGAIGAPGPAPPMSTELVEAKISSQAFELLGERLGVALEVIAA